MLALLHTSPAHVPVFDALRDEDHQGLELRHFVDEELLARARREGPEAVADEVRAVLFRAVAEGARALLCTCSTIGGVVEAAGAEAGLPVLRSDRPMAAAAVAAGSRIMVLATVESTLEPTVSLIEEEARRAGCSVGVEARLGGRPVGEEAGRAGRPVGEEALGGGRPVVEEAGCGGFPVGVEVRRGGRRDEHEDRRAGLPVAVEARLGGGPVEVRTRLVEGAWECFAAGDDEGCARLVAVAADAVADADVIVLAQGSMAPAQQLTTTPVPVLSSPRAGLAAGAAAALGG